MLSIPLGIDANCFQYGVNKPISWLPDKSCHMLIVGASGSGKTYCTLQICGNIALMDNHAKLFVGNYKGDTDLKFLKDRNCQDYFEFDHCARAIDKVYQRLLDRQSGKDESRNLIVLMFDEYVSFLLASEKKTAEQYKSKMAILLMLGRSFRINIIIAIQRADASNFVNGARDNFGIVCGLGNLSPESAHMLFPDHKDQMKNIHGRGCGYITTNGADLREILIPRIQNWDLLHDCIYHSVNRSA